MKHSHPTTPHSPTNEGIFLSTLVRKCRIVRRELLHETDSSRLFTCHPMWVTFSPRCPHFSLSGNNVIVETSNFFVF